MNCPECDSTDVTLEDSEDKYSQNTELTVVWQEYYLCQDCGCEFTYRYIKSREVIIDKHGEKLDG